MYVANNIATKYKVNKILERKGELPLQIQFKLKIFFLIYAIQNWTDLVDRKEVRI